MKLLAATLALAGLMSAWPGRAEAGAVPGCEYSWQDYHDAGVLSLGVTLASTGWGMRAHARGVGEQVQVTCWRARYDQGQRMITLGAVMTVASAALLGLGIGTEAYLRTHKHDPYHTPSLTKIPVSLGAVAVFMSLVTILTGRVRMRNALLDRDRLPPGPRIFYTLSPSGFTLRW